MVQSPSPTYLRYQHGDDTMFIDACMGECKDGNGLDLIQDPRDPNLIGLDLGRFKMNLDRI